MKKRRVELRMDGENMHMKVFKEDKSIEEIAIEETSPPQQVEGIPTMFRVTTTAGHAFFQLDSSEDCKDFLKIVDDEFRRPHQVGIILKHFFLLFVNVHVHLHNFVVFVMLNNNWHHN